MTTEKKKSVYRSRKMFTFKESDGNVMPTKVPNTIPRIVVMTTLAFSFVLRGAKPPLQRAQPL